MIDFDGAIHDYGVTFDPDDILNPRTVVMIGGPDGDGVDEDLDNGEAEYAFDDAEDDEDFDEDDDEEDDDDEGEWEDDYEEEWEDDEDFDEDDDDEIDPPTSL